LRCYVCFLLFCGGGGGGAAHSRPLIINVTKRRIMYAIQVHHCVEELNYGI